MTTIPSWRWPLRGLVFLYGPVIALAPKGAVILLLLTAIVSVGQALVQRHGAASKPLATVFTGPIAWFSLAVAAWMALRLALPSPEPQNMLLWLKVLVLSVTGLAALAGLATAADTDRRRLTTLWLCGVAAGLLLMALAEAHAQLTETTFWGPKARTLLAMEPGRAVLAFALWPALALMRQRIGAGGSLVMALLVLGAFGGFLLVHDGIGTVAWLAGLGVLALASIRASSPTISLAIGPAAILGLAIGLPGVALILDLTPTPDLAGWLPFSALHRLSIWQFTASQIASSPWIGAGADGVRFLAATFRPDYAPAAIGEVALLPLHPHNGFLHAWLEFGLPGLALALAIVVQVARGAARRGPAALATVAGAVTVASLSFGLWQSWWLSSLWLTAAIAAALLPPRV